MRELEPFTGKILVKMGRMVPGSFQVHPDYEKWYNEYPIMYDGDLTEEVISRIRLAWAKSPKAQPDRSTGKLRWCNGEIFVSVDPVRRVLTTSSSRQI